MRELYSSFAEDELWLIKEVQWERPLQNIRESQFALGNGYLGARAVYEELPYDSKPGTYIAGIYDKIGSQVAELVNLPNPINFRFSVDGEKFDLVAMGHLRHKRVLNMKKAVLIRQTLYQDTKRRRYDYRSLRFISSHNKNIGVMQVLLIPLDADCEIEVNTGIDTSVYNTGILTEGRKRHFRVKELGQSHDAGYLVVDTLEKKYTIVYWSGFYYQLNGKKIFAKENIFRLKVRKNQQILFTKVFCIKHFPFEQDSSTCRKEVFKIFYKAFHKDFSVLLKDHIKVWEKFWKKADVLIEGTANLQINLRFNIYHMLICAGADNGFSSIGARTLTGEGYRGHIFWDAEVFLLPFYLFNFPRLAKNMLLYRYNRLDKARALAQKEGFVGAKFPWESADTGEEETPEWARDFDRTIIKIHTHEMEHHITADIAYAVYKYYVATGDKKFMRDYGYKILIEAARFWASRVEFNKRQNLYEIKDVIGPDEFHMGVRNNAYTNMMAKWNLLTACKIYAEVEKRQVFSKGLREKLQLKKTEIERFKEIASKIKINISRDEIIEQFEGYFKLRPVHINRYDENGIPILPPRLRPKDLGRTQLIKQADVLMLVYMLDDVFSLTTKAANYEFYIKRTLHKSSLSPSIHSVIASKVGDLNRAYNLFNVSLRTDLSNLYRNTYEGVHAASLGGTWQAVIFGFAGIEIRKEELCINPNIPRSWKKVIFSLIWRQDLVKLELTNEVVKLNVNSAKQKVVEINIFERPASLRTNKTYLFKRKIPFVYKEYYY